MPVSAEKAERFGSPAPDLRIAGCYGFISPRASIVPA
jgi:hypothetical protein